MRGHFGQDQKWGHGRHSLSKETFSILRPPTLNRDGLKIADKIKREIIS